MSKRKSRSAEFIGKFWNRMQHVPMRRRPRRSGDWPKRAAGFIRFKLHEVRRVIRDGRAQLESPFSKLMVDRKAKVRTVLSEAREDLRLAQRVHRQLRREARERAARLQRNVANTERIVQEFEAQMSLL